MIIILNTITIKKEIKTDNVMIRVFTFFLCMIFIINCSTENNPTSTDTTDEPTPTEFDLHDNGVTILCNESNPGDIGVVNGVEYESVNDAVLLNRLNNGADLSKVCTSKVTNMGSLFYKRNFNQDIGHWDVSNVTKMPQMFYESTFNQDISNWDVSNVTNMGYMFYLSEFNQDIGDWDVSNVTLMPAMFVESNFNQDIGNWDVSNVIDMNYMFNTSNFNQDISNWCVSQISSEPEGFSTNSPLTEENKPKWGTCPGG